MMTVSEVRNSLKFYTDLYEICSNSDACAKYASYYSDSLEYLEVLLNNKKVSDMTDEVYQELLAELKRIQLDFLDLMIVS
uniref:Uncharacterized protein n=1 Tax=Myoviridae sp. ctXXl13 TaxID=2827691 RepID=A0A8S5TKD3_9CAUD|nr:MAG TPA: hypothetical protein [Myoviridae sp. ctXXl13]